MVVGQTRQSATKSLVSRDVPNTMYNWPQSTSNMPAGALHRVGMHVVIGRSCGLFAAGHAPTRKLADLHLGLGVHGNARRFWFLRGLCVDLLQVLEEGVGLGNFF